MYTLWEEKHNFLFMGQVMVHLESYFNARAPTACIYAIQRDAGSRRCRSQNPGPIPLRVSAKFANEYEGIFFIK